MRVGPAAGARLGRCVGAKLVLGDDVGAIGSDVGRPVGARVGPAVGARLGCSVGVRLTLGDDVGAEVGSADGVAVVGAAVGAKVG